MPPWCTGFFLCGEEATLRCHCRHNVSSCQRLRAFKFSGPASGAALHWQSGPASGSGVQGHPAHWHCEGPEGVRGPGPGARPTGAKTMAKWGIPGFTLCLCGIATTV